MAPDLGTPRIAVAVNLVVIHLGDTRRHGLDAAPPASYLPASCPPAFESSH
ncbi:MAG: hypothetical protein J0H91_00425 [Rhodospirillales bacterium]|nr:hypothetical protein [Rhodospirillales bacterium]